MDDKRSLKAFEYHREGAQRFDYFIAGLTGAVFAYLVQNYVPSKLDFNPHLFDLIGLISLIISFYLGLKRIEMSVVGMRLNTEMLDASEKAGVLTNAMANGDDLGFNMQSGAIINAGDIPLMRETYMHSSKTAREALEKIATKSGRYYKWRNRFLFAGFMAILVGKIASPYFDNGIAP